MFCNIIMSASIPDVHPPFDKLTLTNTTLAETTIFPDGATIKIGKRRAAAPATETYVMGLIGNDADARKVDIGIGVNVDTVNIGTGGGVSLISIGNGNIPVKINGNLEVTGGTTTVSSTNTVYSDTLLGLQNGLASTDAPVKDAGLIIKRGSQPNAFIGFDEDVNKFRMAFTTSGADFSGDAGLAFTEETATLLANLEGNATTATTATNYATTGGITDALASKANVATKTNLTNDTFTFQHLVVGEKYCSKYPNVRLVLPANALAGNTIIIHSTETYTLWYSGRWSFPLEISGPTMTTCIASSNGIWHRFTSLVAASIVSGY